MKILLVNAHWDNRGDEAALCALIDAMLGKGRALPHTTPEITIIFKEAANISGWPYGGKVEYITTSFRPTEDEVKKTLESGRSDHIDMQREIDYVAGSDIVIYAPGGAVISDRFWWEKQLEYIFPVAYAQTLGKKTLFASPSVGPFGSVRKLRDGIFEKLDSLCLRESIGMEAVKGSVGSRGNQILSCDLAFIGRVDVEGARKAFKQDAGLISFIEKYSRVVGITASDLSWNVGYLNQGRLKVQIENALKGFMSYLSSQDIGVVLIPQLFGGQDDEVYLKSYINDNCRILDKGFDSNFQQFLISELYAVVGIRYHCNIFAAKMGTPMVPIVYEQKMEGFLKDAGLSDWGIGVTELSEGRLITKFEALEAEYQKRQGILKGKLAGWTKRAWRTVIEIEGLIHMAGGSK